MVSEIRLYIEGGGNGESTKRELRQGFHDFFGSPISEGRVRRIGFKIVLCGGRQQTYDSFVSASKIHPDACNILIVDAESPVSKPVWHHLEDRDGWKPAGKKDARCYLMTQVMEAWFLADAEKLREYYSGPDFHSKALPGTQDIETIPKSTIYKALAEATRHTKKGEYSKIRHASQLLSLIRPTVVRKASRHCDVMFTELEALMRA